MMFKRDSRVEMYTTVLLATFRQLIANRNPDKKKFLLGQISKIEENIAKLIPPTEATGMLARRGAVRAAWLAGDKNKARHLLKNFLAERGMHGTWVAQSLRKVIPQKKRRVTS